MSIIQQNTELDSFKKDPDFSKKLFRIMLRIRRVQEQIDSLYLEDKMKTPVHLCIGQEAIAAGVCAAMRKEDYISSNHRGHGHYLAKGGNLRELISELHCKKTGCSGGFGGSMHIIDTSVGHLGSSSIVGGGIPIGTGMALASKMRKDDLVSVVFFGDGAADEGVLYESINFAVLKKLPVVYILENNKWAVCSPVKKRQVDKNIFHQSNQNLLMTADINGNDVTEVYNTAQLAMDRAKNGDGPSLIECDTYRIPGHAGCREQDPVGYRENSELEHWQNRCPLKTFQEKLLQAGYLFEEEIRNWEEEIKQEIEDAFEYADKSPLPSAKDLNGCLFRE